MGLGDKKRLTLFREAKERSTRAGSAEASLLGRSDKEFEHLSSYQ